MAIVPFSLIIKNTRIINFLPLSVTDRVVYYIFLIAYRDQPILKLLYFLDKNYINFIIERLHLI